MYKYRKMELNEHEGNVDILKCVLKSCVCFSIEMASTFVYMYQPAMMMMMMAAEIMTKRFRKILPNFLNVSR